MELNNNNIKRIHVNQHNIKHNAKGEEQKPVLTVKCGGTTYIGNTVRIDGPSTLVYSACKPLSCGARVWIETHSFVSVGE
jgi:hypothetical protein